jgi:hypothetical protein
LNRARHADLGRLRRARARRCASGRVIVEKLTLVVDAGTIVHPDGAKAQVEGAALWGLSMALHEGSEFVNGSPRDTNLDTYTPLRMGDVPEIEVELMPSNEAPVASHDCGRSSHCKCDFRRVWRETARSPFSRCGSSRASSIGVEARAASSVVPRKSIQSPAR